MSVAVSTPISVLPWQGNQDPALPAGTWFADMAITGDASGGAVALAAILSTTSLNVPGNRLWSLDAFNFSNSDNLARNGQLLVSGFTMNITQGGVARRWTLDTIAGNGEGNTDPLELVFLPVFLGRQNNALALGQVIFTFTTNANTVIYRTFFGGYFWAPAARAVPGGPRRALGDIWGK